MKTENELLTVGAAWGRLCSVFGPLSAKHTAANAERMMRVVDMLLEHGERLDRAPGARELLAFLTEWIEAYEAESEPLQTSTPVELLRHLMRANGLRQRDLAAEFGGQPVVSAVLSGGRRINARHAIALGRRFGVSPAAFIAKVVADARSRSADRTGAAVGATVSLDGTSLTQVAGVTKFLSQLSYERPSNIALN